MRYEELASSLYEFQKKQKSLVILDDIWTKQASDSLKPAFPIGNGGSKIIITTRNKDVAIHVDTQGLVHEPQCLNLDQSWELLKKKAMFPERGPGSFSFHSYCYIVIWVKLQWVRIHVNPNNSCSINFFFLFYFFAHILLFKF